MKQLSNRGAARVGAVWVIVLFVVTLVVGAYAFVANQAAQAAREDFDTARSQQEAAVTERDAALQEHRDLSKLVGYRDEDVVGSTSDLSRVEGGIESLVTGFALGDSIDTFEKAVNPVIEAYNAEQAKVQSLNASKADLQSQIDANAQASREAASELQGQIDTLRAEKNDLRQQLEEQIATLEGDKEDLKNERDTLDDELNQVKSQNDTLAFQLEENSAAATSRFETLTDQLEEVQRRAETPDGEILSISKDLDIGWIDRGREDRVIEGMSFEVHTGHPNPSGPTLKAMCQVLRVNQKTSEVRFTNLADPFDPPVAGDHIYNPIYDPEGTRYAVLVGRFGGGYNEAEVSRMLEEIGITVQEEVDRTTNYLIVGQPIYVDPETGEPLEEAIQPSELPTYKDAQALGCSIFSINQFRQFFKR